MAQIPKTQKKLREAKFFLGRMSEAERSLRLDREDDFDFYLSAFLSAGRSVTFYLRSEQKDSYDGWSPDWRQALVEDARKLLDFMNAQRVAEVHVRGAEAQGDVEMVPVTKLELNPLSRHAYDLHWCDEFGTLEVGHVVHHFEIDRTRERVTETCKRYVALLEKLVQEFDQAFP